MSVNTQPRYGGGDPVVVFGSLFVGCAVGSLVCGFLVPALFQPLMVGVFISSLLFLVTVLYDSFGRLK